LENRFDRVQPWHSAPRYRANSRAVFLWNFAHSQKYIINVTRAFKGTRDASEESLKLRNERARIVPHAHAHKYACVYLYTYVCMHVCVYRCRELNDALPDALRMSLLRDLRGRI